MHKKQKIISQINGKNAFLGIHDCHKSLKIFSNTFFHQNSIDYEKVCLKRQVLIVSIYKLFLCIGRHIFESISLCVDLTILFLLFITAHFLVDRSDFAHCKFPTDSTCISDYRTL